MALATNIVAGEIQLTGDLAGDGGAQVGSNPQLTHMPGLTAGQYINAKITVDAKGRVTAIEAPSAAEIVARVPAATTSTKGVIQVGDNLYINSTDSAGYQEASFGGLISAGTDSTGLANQLCATYSVTVVVDGGIGTEVSAAGSALQTVQDVIDAINNQVAGVTATINSGNIRITSDTVGSSSLITISNDKLFACMTNYSAIASAVDGTGTCELYAKKATDAILGVVQAGAGVNVSNGVISVASDSLSAATTTTLGSVIVPTSGHINVDVNGNISVPVATAGDVGVVQVGSGLSVDGAGVLSVTPAALPIATESSTGVVQVGNGLDVDGSGIISVNTSELTIPDATNLVKGIVQIGTNINVAAGVISVPDATGASKGVAQIGSGLSVLSGVVSAVTATDSTLGVVKSADTTHITIDGAGGLDVGVDVATLDQPNTFTAGQTSAKSTLTSNTLINVDASLSNVFELDLAHNATLANPTNISAGQVLTFVITQTSAFQLAFGTNYKFKGGITPTVSTGAGDIDLMSCVSDGTNLYCSFSRGYA